MLQFATQEAVCNCVISDNNISFELHDEQNFAGNLQTLMLLYYGKDDKKF